MWNNISPDLSVLKTFDYIGSFGIIQLRAKEKKTDQPLKKNQHKKWIWILNLVAYRPLYVI